ncbi:MAG: SDR family NAD(P)-dependent oxidoreductase [Rhodospirillales bacterium]|jgi:3-oxoacyl-[acyl-carrier protein] reductase
MIKLPSRGTLEGKVALLTGAVRRNGLMSALALAGDGASIVINTLKSVEQGEKAVAKIKNAGGKAIFIQADITDEAQVKGMFKKAVDEFGSVDILVNNAADRVGMPFLETSYINWQHYAYHVISGAFLCSQQAIPLMQKAGWGSIVNIAGINMYVGTPERETLCVAKGGLVALTKSVAREFAEQNIRVNAVSPGRIGGERSASADPKDASRVAEVPVGRQGYLEEVAETVRWLCQPSQGFITGQTIHVNGGEYMP